MSSKLPTGVERWLKTLEGGKGSGKDLISSGISPSLSDLGYSGTEASPES